MRERAAARALCSSNHLGVPAANEARVSLTAMRIGAHVSQQDPLGAADRIGAQVVQIFLGDPQSWKKPPERDDAERLRAAPLPVYVHAPYVMNLASTNNRVRHPSRKTLEQTLEAAAAIGAEGVIVHGGHVEDDDDPEEGFANWRKALDRIATPVPVLIENTAGGENAMARTVDRIARLFEVLEGVDAEVGFCLDTCHLHAAGEDLADAVARIRDVTGRVDLVHLNDSKDEAGSGRDRHTNLGRGRIDPDVLVAVVRDADTDVVLETPDGEGGGQAADLAFIRERL